VLQRTVRSQFCDLVCLLLHPNSSMLSRYLPSSVSAPAALALSSDYVDVARIAEAVRAEYDRNVAFRASVADHEATSVAAMQANTPVVSPPKKTKILNQSSSSSGGGRGGGRTMLPNKRDLKVKPPIPTRVPSRVPPSLGSQIVFDRSMTRDTYNTSVSNITELNMSWSLNNHPEVSSWKVLFDQYTLVEASVTWFSQEGTGSSSSIVELHTALDFDSHGALGSLAAIDDFGTAQVDFVVLSKRVTRSVRPCTMADVASVSSLAPTRVWMDCASSTAATWNGIRSIIATSQNAAVPITYVTTLVWAFKNQI